MPGRSGWWADTLRRTGCSTESPYSVESPGFSRGVMTIEIGESNVFLA
jgi:hypothetical protein